MTYLFMFNTLFKIYHIIEMRNDINQFTNIQESLNDNNQPLVETKLV